MRKSLTMHPVRSFRLSLWDRQSISTASALNVLVGIWLLNSGFAFAGAGRAFLWSNCVAGLTVAAFGWIRATGAYQKSWMSVVNTMLGAWIIASPWVLSFEGDRRAEWNNIVVGCLVVLLGFWSATSSTHFAGGGALNDSGAA